MEAADQSERYPTEYPADRRWRMIASRTSAAQAAITRSPDHVPALARTGHPSIRKWSPAHSRNKKTAPQRGL
jgi:hypothetical protein